MLLLLLLRGFWYEWLDPGKADSGGEGKRRWTYNGSEKELWFSVVNIILTIKSEVVKDQKVAQLFVLALVWTGCFPHVAPWLPRSCRENSVFCVIFLKDRSLYKLMLQQRTIIVLGPVTCFVN